uniref:Protein kinase domain-containing protein n=1 Tax=Kalanchoe fedtschenkoi TaxID=63787 RepID=A0A7N0T0I2_KALFE
MGCCFGSPAANPSLAAAGQLSSGTGRSQTTSNSANSGASNGSGGSSFSAGSASDISFNEGQILPTSNLRIFSFLELKAATKNFRADALLGEGGFGGVYKGWIGGAVVAVKKLDAESSQGFEEWESEVSFLGRLTHPNLVKLLGYCWEGKELLLVYEYMPKGSLENHLFGRGSAVQPLTWDLRLKIAIGAARGLSFLHTAKQVIYRDFKTSNILLDAFYNAKLSDFGLAKMGPSASQSHLTTRVMGTYGYAAPEYVTTGHLYVKSDVYGFGVVLVELLTGLQALDANRPSEQFSLVNWVTPYLSDTRRIRKVMDPRLAGKYPADAALQTARLALKCLGLEPKTRPSMKEVVEMLEEIESAGGSPKDPRRAAPRGNRKPQSVHHRSPLRPR